MSEPNFCPAAAEAMGWIKYDTDFHAGGMWRTPDGPVVEDWRGDGPCGLDFPSCDHMAAWLRTKGWTWIVGADDDNPTMVTAEVWRDGFANLGRTFTARTLHAALVAAVQAVDARAL